MRKLLLPVALVLLGAGAVWAAGDQAYLGIFAETHVQQMAGMPGLPPGMDISQLPPEAAAMFAGKATRTLEVRLWSPGIAASDASAVLAPPAGLGVGTKLNLDLYRPQPGQTEPEAAGAEEPADLTIKIYWGSSPTVKPGQPRVIRLTDLTGEQKAAMRRQEAVAQRGSYFYKPDWTTGYWPSGKRPVRIGEQASLAGHYALTTNYTGTVALDNPESVEFLAPIELSSPDLSQPVSLEGAITLQWKPIAGLLGQHAMIMGTEGKHTLLLWTSAETDAGSASFGDWGYLQMAEVRDLVSKRILMKPDQTRAIVPAGIFKNADMASLMMIGYGPGTALAKGQPLPRLQTKTTLMAMLGGKMMSDLGGLGGE